MRNVMNMVKKNRRRNVVAMIGMNSYIQIGDIVEITWDDVRMDDDVVLSNVKPPFHYDQTTNIGMVIYCSRRFQSDWLVITSEIPHDHNVPGAVITAFPPGVMSTAKVKVLRKVRKRTRA